MQENTHQIATAPMVPVEQRAIAAVESDKYAKEIQAYVEKSKDITAVIDIAGREQAHRIAMDLKATRVAIKKAAEGARDDANKFSAAVIAEEKRLTKLITPEEDRILALRDAYDAKVKAEKEAAERIERERKAAIEAKLSGIRNEPLRAAGQSAATITGLMVELENEAPSVEFFQEYFQRAQEVHADALEKLQEQHAAQVLVEENAARAKAEAAAESARVAAQAEDNRRIAAELQKERDRLAELERAADERKKADEAKAEAVRADAQAKIDAQLAKLAAERARVESERQALAIAQEQARVAALPVETVIAALDGPEDGHIDAVACLIDADEQREPIAAPPPPAPAEAAPAPRVPVPEPKQVIAFRTAVRDLLDITDASEIFVLLADELDRALQAEGEL